MCCIQTSCLCTFVHNGVLSLIMVPHHLQYGKLACMTAFTLLNITENPIISMHMQYAPKVFKGIYIIEFFFNSNTFTWCM